MGKGPGLCPGPFHYSLFVGLLQLRYRVGVAVIKMPPLVVVGDKAGGHHSRLQGAGIGGGLGAVFVICLLYTSDAADE